MKMLKDIQIASKGPKYENPLVVTSADECRSMCDSIEYTSGRSVFRCAAFEIERDVNDVTGQIMKCYFYSKLDET